MDVKLITCFLFAIQGTLHPKFRRSGILIEDDNLKKELKILKSNYREKQLTSNTGTSKKNGNIESMLSKFEN